MGDIPVTEAHLLGVFFGCILYGLHFTTYGFCTKSLLFSRRRNGRNWAWFALSSLLFVNGTFDLVLYFHQVVRAFVYSAGAGGPDAVFYAIGDWENISKTVSVIVQTMTGDAMLIYRCWIVYNKSWRAISIPALLWVGCIGATIWAIWGDAKVRTNALLTSKENRPTALVFWALTNGLNVVATALLIFRIWQVDRMNQDFTFRSNNTMNSRRILRQVMRIIIESGLLYSTASFLNLVTLICKSSGVYVTTAIETHLAAIAFNLILIRVSRLRGRENTVRARSISLSFAPPTPVESTFPPRDAVQVRVPGSWMMESMDKPGSRSAHNSDSTGSNHDNDG
ncbi:hypothetical protein CPC08DRAFT_823485 [Agrocybe pediades]|nr:hypothetical protein CPC08DRAFT_823485 [Agrocybe pediades]